MIPKLPIIENTKILTKLSIIIITKKAIFYQIVLSQKNQKLAKILKNSILVTASLDADTTTLL